MQQCLVRAIVCVAFNGALAFAAPPRAAAAGPKKLPIRAVECGETVTESFRAANNLRNCAGNGLIVGAPDLTIDLGGHRIDGTGAAGSIGIDNSAGHDGVALRNGIVTQFEDGVLLQNATRNAVSSLQLFDNESGVRLASSSANVLDGNVAAGNGIGFRAEFSSNDNSFTGNDVSGNDSDGLYVEASSGNTFTGNTVSGNGAYGFELFTVSGSTLKRNIARGNEIDGIILDTSSTDNVVKGNNASANDADGIEVVGGSGNALIKNTTDENGVHGIESNTNAVTLTRNRANGNGFVGGGPGDDVGLGILVPSGATQASNKASGNDDPNECEAADVACHVP